MKQAVVGLLAHVDAGKTTLAEAMLLAAGAIRTVGRVDRGDSHLDTDPMERERGITIFASQASLDWNGTRIMLLDAPGHVDFSAEAERTIAALDCALLVVGANDGIQGHTETLWDLLRRHQVPTLIFVNKCDLEHPGRSTLMADLRVRLPPPASTAPPSRREIPRLLKTPPPQTIRRSMNTSRRARSPPPPMQGSSQSVPSSPSSSELHSATMACVSCSTHWQPSLPNTPGPPPSRRAYFASAARIAASASHGSRSRAARSAPR